MEEVEDTQKQKVTTSQNTVQQYCGNNESPLEGEQSSDDDEDSECNIMDSALVRG